MSTTTRNTKKSSKTSVTKRRKSSSSKRKNSKGDTSSIQSLTESNSGEISKDSQISSIKSLIDYQEEVTMIFFRSMLPIIIEKWEVISPETEIASISAESLKVDDINDISETDLRTLDLTTSVMENSKFLESTELITVPSLQKESKEGESSTKSGKFTSQSNLEGTETGETVKTESSYLFTVDSVKVMFKNGNYYQGPIYRTLFHGIGKFVWKDGTQYEGEFRNGEITGKGILIYSDLSYYKGDFCKGILNGKGIKFIHSSAMLYNGEWKRGKKHGKGWLLYKPGVWYDGEWAEDYYEGYGMRRYDSHMSYKGHWLKGLQHGAGTMVWQNHDIYIGEWKEGLMNGYGEYTWNAILTRTLIFPIRNSFKGSWLQGMRDGAGIMDFGTEGGAKLAGIWQCDYKHGPGVFICGNGKSVEGDPLFVFDKPANTHSAHIYMNFFAPKSSEKSDGTTDNLVIIPSKTLNDDGEKCKKNLNELLNAINETTGTTTNMKSEPYQIVGIDMYAAPEEIDIANYLTFIIDHLEEDKHTKSSEIDKALQADDVHFTTSTDLGLWASSVATGKKFVKIVEARLNPPKENEVENETEFSPELEEQRFREIIIKRMLSLQDVYKYYATLTSQKTTNYNVVMYR
ncbi:uncharacterized protein LOC108736588 isoform X2 [Agrilus planipennis]|uniref:Uncharacterized protein LOC108736588 isoform X2 n=1 Tax=Agrilus planipennis TaxID=224129 RepID=A0A7F5RD70_AGRPL|nr:uncharacterized protein LOC108736588 isoform X2 [Agrilus planipennis]